MDDHLLAVLIHERPEPFQALQGALGDLSVESHCAQTWSEARNIIAQYQPLLIFVDLSIWRKSHTDMVMMANAVRQVFNIVVVGMLPDIEKYISVVEQGAFSFVAPPFSHDTLTLIVHSAAVDARNLRESRAEVPWADAVTSPAYPVRD
jgi:DNA-binding NtrC family response regulator